jgi:hypothetical protein
MDLQTLSQPCGAPIKFASFLRRLVQNSLITDEQISRNFILGSFNRVFQEINFFAYTLAELTGYLHEGVP